MTKLGVLTLPPRNHEEDSRRVIIWILMTGKDEQITIVERGCAYSNETLILMEDGEVAQFEIY